MIPDDMAGGKGEDRTLWGIAGIAGIAVELDELLAADLDLPQALLLLSRHSTS